MISTQNWTEESQIIKGFLHKNYAGKIQFCLCPMHG